jgi:hypothetical protein
MNHRLLTAAPNPTSGVHKTPLAAIRNFAAAEGVVQVTITGTATAILRGRSDPNAATIDIKTYTASGSDIVALFPEMWVDVTAGTGTVDAFLTA